MNIIYSVYHRIIIHIVYERLINLKNAALIHNIGDIFMLIGD